MKAVKIRVRSCLPWRVAMLRKSLMRREVRPACGVPVQPALEQTASRFADQSAADWRR